MTARLPRCLALSVVAALLVAAAGHVLAQEGGSIRNPPPPTDESYRRDLQLPYRDVLKKNQLSPQDRQLLEKVVHYKVYELIREGQELERNRNLGRFQQDMRSRTTTPAARQYALEQMTRYAAMLLNESTIDAKVVAAHVLSQLNASFGPPGQPDVPFVPASGPLMRILDLPDSDIAAKVVAAEGLGRILRFGEPPLTTRIDISGKLADELVRMQKLRGTPEQPPRSGYEFYVWNLTTALGEAQRVYNQTREPKMADALMSVLTDDKMDFLARARAAHSLSRLSFDGASNHNISLLNYEVARLVHDAAVQYNANRVTSRPWPMWRRVATRVYLAYEAYNDSERNRGIGLRAMTSRPGLNTDQGNVNQARELILPIVNTLVRDPRGMPAIDEKHITALAEWLKANVPTNRKLTPQSPEIGIGSEAATAQGAEG